MYIRKLFLYFIFYFFIGSTEAQDRECKRVKFNHSSVMCRCDTNYCDTIHLDFPPPGEYLTITSSREGLRFYKEGGRIDDSYYNYDDCKYDDYNYDDCNNWKLDLKKKRLILKINRKKKYQKMVGFGAAFTDSAGINTAALSKDMQEKLLRAYYSESGLEYNLGRVPIGGTDFSTRAYTYDDNVDGKTDLEGFELQEEDFKYKIPYIKMAKKLAKEKLLLTAACWSPPLFMKAKQKFRGRNYLVRDYYGTYAKYHIRFLEEYKKHGIEFWFITPGNEPTNGLYSSSDFTNSVGWLADKMATFVADFLSPALRNSEFNDTKLFILDDCRSSTFMYLTTILRNKRIKSCIDGVAVHWYDNDYVSAKKMEQTLKQIPELPVVTTEMCEGSFEAESMKKGCWKRAEAYAKKIIDDMLHHSVGFIDWNFALDMTGGPCYTNNLVDAPIVVDTKNNVFYKQTSYYAFGHFTKFISRGSRRVEAAESTRSEVDHVAFLRPDGYIAVVLHNSHEHAVYTTIHDEEVGTINIKLPMKSVTTVLY